MKKYAIAIFTAVIVSISGCSSSGISQEQYDKVVAERDNYKELYENLLESQEATQPSDDSTDEAAINVIETDFPETWEEYIKKDSFGDVAKKERKVDPDIWAHFSGTGMTSISINEYDVEFGVYLCDYRHYGDHGGERLMIIPLFSSGTKMISLEKGGRIEIKTANGEKNDMGGKVDENRFIFVDYDNYFIEHLKNGDDMDVVLYTNDGGYQFKFTITSDNFNDIYEKVSAKHSSK